MGKITLALFGIAVLGLGVFAITREQTIEVQNPAVAENATSTVEVELDNVSEAQKQLNEAKSLLDEEDALIAKEIETLEARREEIRAVRLSFSQAPAQAN